MPSSMALLIHRRALHGRTSSLLQVRLFSRLLEPAAAAAPKRRTLELKPIEKILVVNRGEIACRIMRTARRLGIPTVAVYSDADAGALHVRSADKAVHIGPAPARLSYLSGASIVDAARSAGAQAIHPGYGFLSESAEFAQLCEDNGLTFIGPPASAIRDTGDKRYHGDEQDIDFMRSEVEKIGYPILIKPTHGGGGKGTVVAPMAGLVVKVLAKDGMRVEEGQPILVLEAMKMEHVVKAPSAGHVHGLAVTAGQQVPDSSVLFSIKVSSKDSSVLFSIKE